MPHEIEYPGSWESPVITLKQEEPVKESNIIVIMQVGNGFIVRPPTDMRNGNFLPDDSIHVFQTMGALLGYIKNHFTDQPKTGDPV